VPLAILICELIPKSYLRVEDEIMKMREEKKKNVKELPIVDLRSEFVSRLGDMQEDEVMRAIGLLRLWGSCIHFGGSEVLSKYLVVDPTFLTQEIMSSLFHPDHAKMIRNGLLPHHYLRDIWPGYVSKAEFLLALMEKFEVCFELGDRTQQPQEDSQPHQPKKDFWERESVITSYLSEQPPSSDFNPSVDG